jgi:succinate dehydrogenase / fumarate reductase cytochrome b subunit
MSKSNLMWSSIARKYWMALTGLFLCTFLIGHLIGNLQLVLKTGEEGRRAFNEYAYFMGHNVFIKVLAYATYISIIAHAIIGLYLAVKNKQARPVDYAYSNPSANSSTPSRYMAILGTIILVFIVTHMANFWWKQKITEDVPLHIKEITTPANPMMGGQEQKVQLYLLTSGNYAPINKNEINIKNHTEFFDKQYGLKIGEGYKDLHTVVMTFFSKQNSQGLMYVLFYVISMAVLAFHLWHGFSSTFQSLGVNHSRYTGIIHSIGKVFAVGVSIAFAVIPVLIYLRS